MIVDVVFVIGMAATAAAFVVASTIGNSLSVVKCVEFNKMLGIVYCVCDRRQHEINSHKIQFSFYGARARVHAQQFNSSDLLNLINLQTHPRSHTTHTLAHNGYINR